MSIGTLLARPARRDYVVIGDRDASRLRREEIARAAIASDGPEAELYFQLVRKLRQPCDEAELGAAFEAFHDEAIEWAEATLAASTERWPAE